MFIFTNLYINKLYRKTFNELYLWNKVQSSDRIKEDGTLIANEKEVVMGLNISFSNAVIDLKIQKT